MQTGHRQTSPTAADPAFLGIYANTICTPANPKPKRIARDASVDATRRMRYQLQRVAQGLIPGERVKHCQRSTMSGGGVSVYRSVEGGASYGNLTTCGSVWHCPVCAAKITEHKRVELQKAITAWTKQGGEVYLMSQTFPHLDHQLLANNLKMFAEAQKKFKGSRQYTRILEEAGCAGSIRALEVKYGDNGWHPHTHTLVFAKPGQLKVLQQLDMVWIDTLIKIGLAERSQLNDLLLFAFDIRNGDYAAEYVAKFGREPSEKSKTITESHWGASHELTKGHSKVGLRFGGRTPFTLLRDFSEGDAEAGELFIEYAKHFKGKRQLFWSPKLRKALALQEEEKTDEEIAAEEVPEREFVTMLDHEQWRLVLSRNARFEVLRVADDEGAPGVARLLEELAGRRPSHSDHYWERGRGGYHHLGGFIGKELNA